MTEYRYEAYLNSSGFSTETYTRKKERKKLPPVLVSVKPAFENNKPVESKWQQDFPIGEGFTVRLEKCGSPTRRPRGCVLTVKKFYQKWYRLPVQPLKAATIPFDTAVTIGTNAVTLTVLAVVLPVVLLLR